MKLLIFETGESSFDVQSKIVDFEGTLYEYDRVELEGFKNIFNDDDNNITLIRSGYSKENKNLVYVYYCKSMDKVITRYVIPI